jgi:hypothetical protein
LFADGIEIARLKAGLLLAIIILLCVRKACFDYASLRCGSARLASQSSRGFSVSASFAGSRIPAVVGKSDIVGG